MGASVLARLKNKAAETGRSYQLCMQLFCQEEFMRRLEKTKYVDNFVLKGGLFLYTLTNYDSRVTMDVDFLLRQILLRMNRSIQSEGAFGVVKQDYGFRQFLLRGRKKVLTEILLVAMAYDINKLHARIQQSRTGTQLFVILPA